MSTANALSQFTVAVAPLGNISDWQIELTKSVLEGEFGVQTLTLPPMEIPKEYFNTERNCYQTRKIIDFLFPQLPIKAQRIMGIVEGNLENANKEPNFGSARSVARVAIYGVACTSEQKRYLRHLFHHLIVHEFTHTLGIIVHCLNPQCAMNEKMFKNKLCDNCRKWADRELKVRPGSAEERFSFAESLLLHERFTEAISAYGEAISNAPHEPLYHHRLIQALSVAGQKDKLVPPLKLALALGDGIHSWNYAQGISHLLDDLKQAESSFAKMIALATNPQKTHKLIRQAYREIAHNVELASKHYHQYLRLGGDDPNIIDWLISRNQMDQP